MKARSRILGVIPALVLCLPLIVSSGCAFFSRQPALPRRAAIDSTADSGADEKFALLIESADIIYFPSELVGPPRRSESSWKLVEALQRNGGRFALGWDLIGGEEQSILDQWRDQQLPAQTAMERLHLHGGARENETGRSFLREAHKRGAHFIALRFPAGGSAMKDELSRSFHPPPDDFEKFAKRFSADAEMSEAALRAEYEAALLREQFAAECVAGYFREHRSEKLLVFLHRRQLGNSRGVPYFVAQKIKARQLVLDSRQHPPESPRLLAGGRSWPGQTRIVRSLQIVNSPPGAGRDQL